MTKQKKYVVEEVGWGELGEDARQEGKIHHGGGG